MKTSRKATSEKLSLKEKTVWGLAAGGLAVAALVGVEKATAEPGAVDTSHGYGVYTVGPQDGSIEQIVAEHDLTADPHSEAISIEKATILKAGGDPNSLSERDRVASIAPGTQLIVPRLQDGFHLAKGQDPTMLTQVIVEPGEAR